MEDMVTLSYKQLFANTYKGKKVLLTGHTGFKGSWLLAWLHRLGATVKGYSLAPEHDNDLYNLLGGSRLCDSVIADIRDRAGLAEVIKEFQPDFIFHLAAQALVRRSYRMPADTFEVNTAGTANILEGLFKLDKPCIVVIITTDKVYENLEKEYHYKETDKLGGYDPYSASKAAAEIVVSSYRNSFFNPASYNSHGKSVATARAGNVIGGGDRSEDRIIPDIIRAFEAGQAVVVRNPGAVRPWQHVLEPLSGYLLLGAKMKEEPAKYCEAWNFGPYNEDVLTVEQVVKQAISVWGGGEYTTPALKEQPHEANLLQLDITKAITYLGWKPKLNSTQAIQQTIDWYRQLSSQDAARLVLAQLDKYEGQA
jgi:CDP-glucose 4,6-dehydratase